MDFIIPLRHCRRPLYSYINWRGSLLSRLFSRNQQPTSICTIKTVCISFVNCMYCKFPRIYDSWFLVALSINKCSIHWIRVLWTNACEFDFRIYQRLPLFPCHFITLIKGIQCHNNCKIGVRYQLVKPWDRRPICMHVLAQAALGVWYNKD